MATGDLDVETLRIVGPGARGILILGSIAVFGLINCSSIGKDSANESWICFKTKDDKEPCQCQTTPVLGKQEIVAHCDHASVQTSADAVDAECCRDWIWLNGKRESAYYCSCYVKGARSCNVDIGDELVEQCP